MKLEPPSPPVRDRRVWLGWVGADFRPFRKEYGRCGVVPPDAAVRKACQRRADGLANGEVDVMARERDFAGGYPHLGEGGVGVDQGAAAEPVYYRCGLGVPEI